MAQPLAILVIRKAPIVCRKSVHAALAMDAPVPRVVRSAPWISFRPGVQELASVPREMRLRVRIIRVEGMGSISGLLSANTSALHLFVFLQRIPIPP